MPRFLAPALAAVLLGLASSGAAAPVRVVTLCTVLTEIAQRIGGDQVAVTGLVQPGVDPHTFEPSPRDMEEVADADLVLAGGLGLENYLDKLVANSGTRGRVLAVGAVLGDGRLTLVERGRTEPDPHWWNSLAATAAVTREVGGALTALRPDHAAAFAARQAAYLDELAALDRWARRQLAAIPEAHRVLITTHDAFGWFARDYGFRVLYLNGLSPEAEPDARGLARTIDEIRASGVPTLFVESSANPRLVAMVSRETGARLGGSLYADGLSPDPDGSTYATMYRHNVRTIADGLR